MTIFNCVDAVGDGKTYMYVDLSIECWEGDHKYYANRFGIPILVIWVLGLPLITYGYLFKKRRQLDTA